MQNSRLPSGGRIDRKRPLNFRFNGQRLEGYAGDTLASALLANDIAVVGRSFKYHRPRGIIGSGAEEPNAIVQLGSGATAEPALRATQICIVRRTRSALRKGLARRQFRSWCDQRLGRCCACRRLLLQDLHAPGQALEVLRVFHSTQCGPRDGATLAGSGYVQPSQRTLRRPGYRCRPGRPCGCRLRSAKRRQGHHCRRTKANSVARCWHRGKASMACQRLNGLRCNAGHWRIRKMLLCCPAVRYSVTTITIFWAFCSTVSMSPVYKAPAGCASGYGAFARSR